MIFQLYCGSHRQEYPEETTDQSQITVKLNHTQLYQVQLTMYGNQTHKFRAVPTALFAGNI